MICEVCGNNEAFVQPVCIVYSGTMCSKCRRLFHSVMGSRIEWKAYIKAKTAFEVYMGNNEIDKAIKTRELMDDMLLDMFPLVESCIVSLKQFTKTDEYRRMNIGE